MMKTISAMGILLGASLLWTPTAWATLNVDVLDAQITSGGSGFIDVVVTGMPDDVASHSIGLDIAPLVATSLLEFAPVQTSVYYTSANYIYPGNSANAAAFIDARLVFPGNLLLTDLDLTDNFLNESISNQRLLLRADLSHIIPAVDPNLFVGDTFQVSINNGFTSFEDAGFVNVPFTSSPGTVTIAAVPEPGTLLLVGSALGLVGYRRYRRRKVGESSDHVA